MYSSVLQWKQRSGLLAGILRLANFVGVDDLTCRMPISPGHYGRPASSSPSARLAR